MVKSCSAAVTLVCCPSLQRFSQCVLEAPFIAIQCCNMAGWSQLQPDACIPVCCAAWESGSPDFDGQAGTQHALVCAFGVVNKKQWRIWKNTHFFALRCAKATPDDATKPPGWCHMQQQKVVLQRSAAVYCTSNLTVCIIPRMTTCTSWLCLYQTANCDMAWWLRKSHWRPSI